MYTWTPKRLYFLVISHMTIFFGHTAYILKFRILSCTHAGVIMTRVFFKYVFNILSIFFNIVQSCNCSICFQYLSIFFKHATCRQILPNMGIWPKKKVISPNSAVFGQITGKKWSYGVPGMYMYIYIYMIMYIYMYIYIYPPTPA